MTFHGPSMSRRYEQSQIGNEPGQFEGQPSFRIDSKRPRTQPRVPCWLIFYVEGQSTIMLGQTCQGLTNMHHRILIFNPCLMCCFALSQPDALTCPPCLQHLTSDDKP